jgi:hypothetical protein
MRNHNRSKIVQLGGVTMIDNQSGSGYCILRNWRFKGADGTPQEAIVVANTLLPVQIGSLSKRYVVRCGTPFAQRFGNQRGILGEFDDLAEACRAAEAFIGDSLAGKR